MANGKTDNVISLNADGEVMVGRANCESSIEFEDLQT